MNKWIKYALLTVLLIGSGIYFGYICGQVKGIYGLLMSPSWELFEILLWILVATITFAVSAGLVAALFRPIWIAIMAFLIASIAMVLSWELSLGSGLMGLGLFLGSSIYALNVKKEISERIKFSVDPISRAQGILLTTLILAICGGIYMDCAEHITNQGFVIPDKYMQLFMQPMQQQILSNMPAEQQEQVKAEMEAQFRNIMDNLYEERIKPYERYVPLVLTVGIFFTLKTVESFVSWIPTILLQMFFAILVQTKFVSETSEAKETKRLIIE